VTTSPRHCATSITFITAFTFITSNPMLPFRTLIFAAVAGICLWGLFSLLDQLKEPGLLRTDKATVVKGCDDWDKEAQRVCPPLFCEKELIDRNIVGRRSHFKVTVDRVPADAAIRLVGGEVYRAGFNEPPHSYFACVVQTDKVQRVTGVTLAQLQALHSASDWRALLKIADDASR
jgi:hypothetical protein